MRPNSTVLTSREIEIMTIVWQFKTATTRSVYEELLKRRKLAYTTVMTMMNILVRKGYLRRKRRERAYVYHPSMPERKVIARIVREFVVRVFDGSVQDLLAYLPCEEYLCRPSVKAVGLAKPQAIK
jgi:BlaI family transcriptional regulator, penicillinase repressor